MTPHLTAGQLALLESALLQRQRVLDRRLAEHTQGVTRAEHAREVLLQDGDDAPQRESEREVDGVIIDNGLQELGAVSEALRRLHADAFGLCAVCGGGIPFDRLKVEPWALRCVPCQADLEQSSRG